MRYMKSCRLILVFCTITVGLTSIVASYAVKAQSKSQAPSLKPARPTNFINSLGMSFQLIQPGKFVMGSPPTEKTYNPGFPRFNGCI